MRPLAAHMPRLWIVCLLVFCGTSFGDYVVTAPDMLDELNSFGEKGNASNGKFEHVYAEANAIYTQVKFEGVITANVSSTFLSEADFSVGLVPGASVDFSPAAGGTFSAAPIQVDGVSTAAEESRKESGQVVPVDQGVQQGLFWLTSGNTLSFEAFENPAGGSGTDSNSDPDAIWTRLPGNSGVRFTFSEALNSTNSFTLFEGSNTISVGILDSSRASPTAELAIYDLAGNLITNSTTSLTASLSTGNYLLAVAGGDASFANGAALSGTDDGEFTARANGQVVGSKTLGVRQMAVFPFNVTPVPEPSAFLYLGFVCLTVQFIRQYGFVCWK